MEVHIFISNEVNVLTFLDVNQRGTGHSRSKTFADVRLYLELLKREKFDVVVKEDLIG